MHPECVSWDHLLSDLTSPLYLPLITCVISVCEDGIMIVLTQSEFKDVSDGTGFVCGCLCGCLCVLVWASERGLRRGWMKLMQLRYEKMILPILKKNQSFMWSVLILWPQTDKCVGTENCTNTFSSLWNCSGPETFSWIGSHIWPRMHLYTYSEEIQSLVCLRPPSNVVWVIGSEDTLRMRFSASHLLGPVLVFTTCDRITQDEC